MKQIIIRNVDEELHRKVKAIAALEGKSLNALAIELFEKKLKAYDEKEGE